LPRTTERWCKWREGKGLGCVPGDRTLLERHILPAIGKRDVRTVTRDDLKRLVTELDAKAATGKSADGWERARIRPLGAPHVDSRQLDPTRVDVSARELVAFGPEELTVEDVLARAIEGAVSAGRWDVVALLAKEIEARRLAAAGGLLLPDERAKKAPPR
jgi:hypothetical protein